MSLSLELTRPDDLLNLLIEGDNLRLDVSEPDQPALVVDDGDRPGFLRVIFPPQSIAESAVFEASLIEPEADPDAPLDPDTAKTVDDPVPLPTPGTVAARIARSSRLVFKVPPDTRIPFSIEGILDWSRLELSVHPLAAIPPDPTAAQIAAAPAVSAPTPTQTALELPYQLIVSPSHRVRWAHRRQPFTARGRTEMWHTRLQLVGPQADEEAPPQSVELSLLNPAPLRAIWSPDFNPGRPPANVAEDPDLRRAAMSPSDRHQLVILTSAFHGYEVERELMFGAGTHIGGPFILPPYFKLTLPHVPKPFYAEQVMLSPLGGWLKSRGHWTPPRTARPAFHFPGLIELNDLVAAPEFEAERPLLDGLLVPFRPDPIGLFQQEPVEDRLDLSEWVHVATQGRDHYVRIVYEGELWPFRNRAALVKVTERKFKEHAGGLVVAHLFQRMFIIVREPEKRFPATDRGMPFKKVRLTTLVTPNIAEPKVTEPSFAAGTHRSFWVEVLAPGRVFFKFHAVGTDVGGDDVDFTVPLMFVSIAETEDTRKKAAIAYNAIDKSPRRSAVVPGQKLLFAERAALEPNDNTQLVTRALNFVMDAAGSAPAMLKADVNVPQVQELLGSDAPTTIRYYKGYVDHGFDPKTGVFAEVVKEDPATFKPTDPFASLIAETLGVTFQSDQAGGIATPNLGVSTLSRALGPLAGKVTDAIAGAFDPATFFKKGAAQLFGTFDLIDLLVPGATMGTNAPKLRTESQNIPGGKLLVATLDWEPHVKDVQVPPAPAIPIASFTKDHGGTTTLLIHGRIEKPVTIDSLGMPVAATVTSAFTGTLNDFRVGVLNAVFINFKTFGFESRTNAKPDVKVALDPSKPMEFAGDLKFVEELRKAIPPNLFGKGPSLDLVPSPLGIRAGFAFALPPVAVGVFALKDVSLGAALTLPFLDGKPAFDFNVSERARPFLLSVAIFGGGGFFHLQLDTAGLRLVEAAFEFGATASIDIGVASGGVHIMAGIYFKLERKEPGSDLAPTLSGYLRMGGYLSVLGLIKVSLEFNLSFTYDGAKDKAYGRATLTVKVEIVFFSTSVELTVEKAFGGASGDPKFGQTFPAPSVWSEYALAFA